MTDKTDPFQNTRKVVAGLEAQLAREEERFSEVSAQMRHEMAAHPGSERGYREAIGSAYQGVMLLREQLIYWRTKLPPFAEARDNFIILQQVTPGNEHLLRSQANPPGTP